MLLNDEIDPIEILSQPNYRRLPTRHILALRPVQEEDPRRIVNRRLFIRLLITVLLVIVYFGLDWTLIQVFVRDAVTRLLGLLGHKTLSFDAVDGPYILVGFKNTFSITAHCTYIDFVLILAAFCWRFNTSLVVNLSRLLLMATVIMALNIIRIVLAIHFHQTGVSWFFAHNVPHWIIQLSMVIPAVLIALKTDYFVSRCAPVH
jgi:exosortase/archaeosortase family protein